MFVGGAQLASDRHARSVGSLSAITQSVRALRQNWRELRQRTDENAPNDTQSPSAPGRIDLPRAGRTTASGGRTFATDRRCASFRIGARYFRDECKEHHPVGGSESLRFDGFLDIGRVACRTRWFKTSFAPRAEYGVSHKARPRGSIG